MLILKSIENLREARDTFPYSSREFLVIDDAIKILKDLEIKLKAAISNDGWISAKTYLPRDISPRGFYARHQVLTCYGATTGWYNPANDSWSVILWYISDKFREIDIDFERGDIPHLTTIRDWEGVVLAWQEFPDSRKIK